jgi:hypothetical protein
LVLVSVILTIIVLNFHFRGPKKQRVPKWMRKYLIGYVGRLLCFCFNDTHQREDTELQPKTTCKKFLSDSESFITVKTNSELPENSMSECSNENGYKFGNVNDKRLRNCQHSDSFRVLSRNLEKMLVKLQKSFNPLCLKDEDLKFAILKEILECQRLLLNKNIEKTSSSSPNTVSINEIYDEWKVLAMIVDRICFFLYLFALILSSTIFFVREQGMNNDKS